MIEWTSIPFMIGGKKNIIAIGIPIAMWVIVLLFWGVGWFILSVMLVGGAIFPYFSSTRYTLSNDEIRVNSIFTKQRKKWETYRSFYIDKNGIFLSPFKKPSRLENFRGLYIRFHGNRNSVIKFVKNRMEQTDE